MFAANLSIVCFLLSFPIALASNSCAPGWGPTPKGLCEICQPGHFDAGHKFCEPCAPNTYQPEAGQTSCIDCPQSTHSRSGATICRSCTDGQLLLPNNTCGVCPAGQYVDRRRRPFASCQPCQTGFFKAEQGFGPCLPCARNSYSAVGASKCVSCAEGQALLNDGSCRSCPAGTYYEANLLACSECPPGTYTNSPNVLRRCHVCGGNSFAPRGSTECVECPANEVYISSSGRCEKCLPGHKYSSVTLSCERCTFNYFSVYENEPFCVACALGSFARRGSSTCFACPRGMVYLAARDACGECSEEEPYDRGTARCGSG